MNVTPVFPGQTDGFMGERIDQEATLARIERDKLRARRLQVVMAEQHSEDMTRAATIGAKQTRIESLVEAWINVAIGFGINFAANWFILPLFGFTTLTLANNVLIGLAFTVISVARQYVIRRWAQDHLRAFNRALSLRIRKVIS